jgi:hypothetical protein
MSKPLKFLLIILISSIIQTIVDQAVGVKWPSGILLAACSKVVYMASGAILYEFAIRQ